MPASRPSAATPPTATADLDAPGGAPLVERLWFLTDAEAFGARLVLAEVLGQPRARRPFLPGGPSSVRARGSDGKKGR